jgi:hypothetical protein
MSTIITSHLMGGLGNQMFQYASARSIAYNNDVPLYLDSHTGFYRDKIYKRKYELFHFPIKGQVVKSKYSIPFWNMTFRKKILGYENKLIYKNIFTNSIIENQLNFIPEITNYCIKKSTWMHGYWQSEKYFDNIKDLIAKELTPPKPKDDKFLEIAKLMNSCNSVSVGVRLFEEVPEINKEGVGGLTDIEFFNSSAYKINKNLESPEFFVFCTTNSPELKKLDLPGKVHLITHENGYNGTLARLWLMTQCKNHIIANSSFYWWGAWLSEINNNYNSKIIASSLFSNVDTVPERWH